jgi:hypothetical protein
MSALAASTVIRIAAAIGFVFSCQVLQAQEKYIIQNDQLTTCLGVGPWDGSLAHFRAVLMVHCTDPHYTRWVINNDGTIQNPEINIVDNIQQCLGVNDRSGQALWPVIIAHARTDLYTKWYFNDGTIKTTDLQSCLGVWDTSNQYLWPAVMVYCGDPNYKKWKAYPVRGIKNLEVNKCLGAVPDAPFYRVVAFDCTDTRYTIWQINSDRTIENPIRHECLGVWDRSGQSEWPVVLVSCKDPYYTKWKLTADGKLQTADLSSCIGLSDNYARMIDCNKPYTKWAVDVPLETVAMGRRPPLDERRNPPSANRSEALPSYPR